MNKIYLKDLDRDTLKMLLENNDNFMEQFYKQVYEDNMNMQYEEGGYMLGEKHYEYIDIRDNYNSFYLVLKNWRAFIDNLDSNYLCDKGIDLYNYIISKKEILDNMCQYSDRYDNLEEHLEEKCKELLEICERQLHEYEKYPDFEEVFDVIWCNEWYLEEEYYTDKDMKNIYLDIAYTKKW